ncbi:unnamed protein product [Caenorhabditis nigoni]
MFQPGPRLLIVPCLIRPVFIPFFIFGNCFPNDRSMPVLYSNEWIFFIGNTIMAFTKCHLKMLCSLNKSSSLTAVQVTVEHTVKDAEYVERTGLSQSLIYYMEVLKL